MAHQLVQRNMAPHILADGENIALTIQMHCRMGGAGALAQQLERAQRGQYLVDMAHRQTLTVGQAWLGADHLLQTLAAADAATGTARQGAPLLFEAMDAAIGQGDMQLNPLTAVNLLDVVDIEQAVDDPLG